MLKKLLNNQIISGLSCGILGVLLAFLRIRILDTDAFVDLLGLPSCLAALFIGPLAGLVGGAVAVVGRFSMPCMGIDAVPCVASMVGTISAVLVAVMANKWIFYGSKSEVMPSALTMSVSELVMIAAVMILWPRDVNLPIQSVCVALVAQCLLSAIVAAICSLVLRRGSQRISTNLQAIAIGIVIALTGFAVWFVQERMAIDRAVENVTNSMSDVMTGVDYPTEAEMLRSTDQLIRKWKTASAMAKADVAAIAKAWDYDFVAVVDTNGIIIAASDSKAVGRDLSKDKNLREFLVIGKGVQRYHIQLFREPSFPVDGNVDRRDCKHVGLGFRDGSGFVLMANAFGKIADRDYLLGDAVLDWHVGDGGSFVLVDPSSGKVISGNENNRIGKSISEIGLDKLEPIGDGYFRIGTVFGVRSIVRSEPLGFIPVDVYAIIPYQELMIQRNVSTILIVAMVSLILFVMAMVFSTIIRQGKAITRLRAKEDERRQKDMDLAKSIQVSSLVREFPAGVYAYMRTAKEVGGDFYDCFNLSSGKLMLVIADVSGKGIPAALFMMRARTEIRAVSKVATGVAEVMTEVNSRLCQDNIAEMFVTAWIGILDTATGELEWSSAGHNPPLIVKKDGSVDLLKGKNSLVLAGMNGIRYKSNLARLEEGDSLFLYTDGVTEAQSANGDFFGDDRLRLAVTNVDDNPRTMCERVVASVDAFAAGAPQADDITVMSITPLAMSKTNE